MTFPSIFCTSANSMWNCCNDDLWSSAVACIMQKCFYNEFSNCDSININMKCSAREILHADIPTHIWMDMDRAVLSMDRRQMGGKNQIRI
jgi:hypothetical protein